jgi:RNA polymerase sigma-70 factor (ECF subfamily)
MAGDSWSHNTGWTTSLGLLGQLQRDQGQGWQRFIDLYSVLLNYWFQQDNVPETEWADLQQDVYYAVAKGLREFDHAPGKGSFRGWLRVIARNKVADLRRSHAPVPNTDLLTQHIVRVPDEASIEKKLLFKQAVDLIRKDFAPLTWQAFWLVAVEDRRPADVAHKLGMKVEAVYVNKSRVLHRLREEFAGLLHDQPPLTPSHP